MKIKHFMAALAILSLTAGSAQAMEVAGVKFDERLKLEQQDLSLNGAGLRSKVFFKVYAVGLYLPAKAAEVDGVLAAKGPKRIAITLLRDLSGEQFAEALVKYSNAYADQVSMDFSAFRSACRSGRLFAQSEADFGADVSI